MNQHQNNNWNKSTPNGSQGKPQPFTTAWIVMWLALLLEGIKNIVAGFTSTDRQIAVPTRSPMVGDRRSLTGYINTGLHKVERMRRSSAIARQYSKSLETIKLTQRIIRQTPRKARYIYKDYNALLDDARKRVKLLYEQIKVTEGHIKGYDPHALEEEIERWERHATTGNTEVTGIVHSRRELLETIRSFDERVELLASRLGSIGAALEVNHMRVLTISEHTALQYDDDSLQRRMDEASEQLSLLKETLREMGRP
jgi:chromosome segregation ATPase